MNLQPQFTQTDIDSLQTAYQEAIYEVYDAEQIISLRIGELHPLLDCLLTNYHCTTWALITAFNPFSRCLSASENQQRHLRLSEYLQPLNFPLIEAVGKDQHGEWTPEQSLLILGIPLSQGMNIGRLFEQNALVYGELGKRAQLQWLDPLDIDSDQTI